MPNMSLNSIPLEWVRAFELAGRTGSFTAAASESNVTQAAISQRISSLEQRIGSKLFVRKARGVSLSVEGEAWLPYVSAAFRDLEDSYEELFGVQQEKITISASASIIELWLAPRLQKWQSNNKSQIAFSTMLLQTEAQHHEATFRIQYGSGEWLNVHKTPLFTEKICPVVAPELLMSKTPWYELPRLAISGPRNGWQEWARHTSDPTTPVPKIRFDSMSAALAAAISGAGVLLASLPLCSEALEKGLLVRASTQILEPKETYWMIGNNEGLSKSQWNRVVESFVRT